jgi:hypothetical protein
MKDRPPYHEPPVRVCTVANVDLLIFWLMRERVRQSRLPSRVGWFDLKQHERKDE